MAVTEAVWLEADPPEEVKSFWDEAYPAIRDVEANLQVIRRPGYDLLEHFTLHDSAWWDN